MYLLYLLVLLLCVYETQHYQDHNRWKFDVEGSHEKTVHRLLELMRSYYEEANSRLAQLNNIRFMYEESPYYEMGYITGEIIERYRKVLEMVQKPIRFFQLKVPELIKIVELTQRLYFELYHLVRMIHETPRKWSNETEFKTIEKISSPDLLGRVIQKTEYDMEAFSLIMLHQTQENLLETKKRRAKQRRRQKKKLEKMRQSYLMGVAKEKRSEVKAYNKWWPLDYGWEIDYYW